MRAQSSLECPTFVCDCRKKRFCFTYVCLSACISYLYKYISISLYIYIYMNVYVTVISTESDY